MTVRVQYFSRLRDFRGPAEVSLDNGATLQDLLENLFGQVPGLRGWDRHLLLAVGEEYAPRGTPLSQGDVVSLMPPVQGG